MTDIFISARRGAGAPAEILYGTVTFKPTLAHSRSTSIVLPAPTTFDLVDGEVVATNVQPTPEPVEGQIEWAYEVTFKDRHSKTYSFLVGVPDSTSQVNFTTLPRYFETKPPLFGEGPKGEPGEAATVAVGTVAQGGSASVTNSGTSTDAILNFVLPQGPQGPKGDGVYNVDKLFSDTPDSYAAGTTLSNVSTDNGWPINYAMAVTHKRFAGRVVQELISTDGKTFMRRYGGSTTWTDFKSVAYADLATTTTNGLMSSADKTKLDDFGILPINTKLASDPARSYPAGLTTTVAHESAGWPKTDPVSPYSIITTSKAKGNEVAFQLISPYNSSSAGTSLEDPTVFFRVGSSGDVWSEPQKIAIDRGDIARKGDGPVYASDHGAVPGDETVNNKWTLQVAIGAARGRDIILESGKEYFIQGTIELPGAHRRVSIKSSGAEPAIIYTTGQSYKLMNFDCGPAVTTKTLMESTGINSRGWLVNNVTSVKVGMLCEVVSSASWYHDPRPETFPNDARKSELHRVREIVGNKIYMDDVSNDGYNLVDETVELRFYDPIYVKMENITLRGTLPPVAQETGAIEGITITGAVDPILTNVNVENCARNGIRFQRCWRPKSFGGYTRKSNGYYNGYGLVISSCAHALVDGRAFYECKKGVDITGSNVISRDTVIQNCKVFGGGHNSRGENYGWNDDGTIAAHQSGFGAHGGSDLAIYRDNEVFDVQVPFSIKGRSSVCHNNTIVGRTSGGVFRCITGIHLWVTGNTVLAGSWALKPSNSFSSTVHIDDMRADSLVTMYGNWQSSPSSNRRGQLFVNGNYAELRTSLVRMHLLNAGQMSIMSNQAIFSHRDTSRTFYGLENTSGEVPQLFQSKHWTYAMNDLRAPTFSDSQVQNTNTVWPGARVLDFTIAT